jgi:hypothetical protein
MPILHMHGLIFRRTLQNWQDQPDYWGILFVIRKKKKTFPSYHSPDNFRELYYFLQQTNQKENPSEPLEFF